jgi:uncharacterized protein (TIGR03437 family)
MVFHGALAAQPKIVAFVNSASWQSGAPAGGALATALVSGLSGLKPGAYVAPQSGPLPHTLGGVSVAINEDYAPLLAVIVPSDPSATVQINLQVPLSWNASRLSDALGPGSGSPYAGYVKVYPSAGGTAAVQTIGGLESGAFFAGVNGAAIAVHASDSSLVTARNPAHPSESIIAYADDFFVTWPPPPIGIPTPQGVDFQPDESVFHGPGYLYLQDYPQNNCAPNPGPCTGSVTYTPALTVNSMGLAPGLVGVEQINFVVPANQKPGTWALFFNIGSCPDGSGVPGTCGATSATSSPYVLLPVD